ncbi:MAG: DUF1294 domain-containing protein [Clostridiales bacterium]|nr:DUF1294 domain-containing protein [Clostridiales bacterium]
MTLKIIGISFLLVNFIALLLMGIDKYKAIHNHYRIPEKVLFLSALPFSSYGFLLGMKVFHHKTRKLHFKLGSFFLILLHTAVIIYFLQDRIAFEEILSQF